MKILVTGGGGFLGSAVCRQLLERGQEVIAFQRGDASHLRSAGASAIRGDIRDAAAVLDAARGCDAVVHTAGKAGIWGDEEAYRQINVGGTRNVIRACRELGVPVLVHTSSPSVVHTGGDINGGDESLPLATHFRAPYPATKAEAETLVLEASDGELSTCALRPHLIWGPGDPHFLPRLEAKARRGRLALPAPDKRVDTIFVDNAAQAHLMALDELCGEGRCAGKPYFITNNEPLTQGEIISRLLHAIGIEVEIRPVPTVLARAAAAVCETAWGSLRLSSEPPLTRFSLEQLATAHWYDTSAALRDFGYRPAISIADGLERLARWWRDGAR